MGLIHNNSIVSSNLVLCLDAANKRSYDPKCNYFLYSEDFNNAAWGKDTISVTSNATSGPPNTGMRADKVYENSTSSLQHLLYQNPYTAAVGDVNTISVYAKAAERTQISITSWGEGYAVFDLSNGTIVQNGGHTCTITSVGNGWYRCSATITETVVTTSLWFILLWNAGTNMYAGTIGSGVYLAGAQFQKRQSTLGDYVKTTSAVYTNHTTWVDVSGRGYDFTINASAFKTTSNIAHMDFSGPYGAAKRIVGGVPTDVPKAANGTIMIWTVPSSNAADWRTMTRGATGDHQVIIGINQAGYTANAIGMYDNDTSNNIITTFDVNSLPNAFTQFNCLTFKLSNTASPYFSFQYNDNTTKYANTDPRAAFNNGFSCIGAYHQVSIDPDVASQYWGKIAMFMYYDRHLTDAEILQNFNAMRRRYGV